MLYSEEVDLMCSSSLNILVDENSRGIGEIDFIPFIVLSYALQSLLIFFWV